jgi:hypothetical protein
MRSAYAAFHGCAILVATSQVLAAVNDSPADGLDTDAMVDG